MSFDWSQVDHGFSDNRFEDCLFEYSFWDPMDICDYARSYSLTNHFGGVVGANPPTASQAAAIPDSDVERGSVADALLLQGLLPEWLQRRR